MTEHHCRATHRRFLLDFSLEGDKFDKGWQERVALEFEIVNKADLESLRTGLTDENLYVRALAARALGIRADRKSSDAIAALVLNDPEYLVRVRAVEALGLLKMKSEVIEAAKKDKHGAVRWAADLSADIRKQDVDYAEQLRQAFAEGINRNEMATRIRLRELTCRSRPDEPRHFGGFRGRIEVPPAEIPPNPPPRNLTRQ